MNRVRRDVVLMCLRDRKWRLALAVLAMPEGWSLAKSELPVSKPRRGAAKRKRGVGQSDAKP